MVGTRLVPGPPDPSPRPRSASVSARPFTNGDSSVTGAVSNLVPGNGNGGLDSVSNAVGGIAGGQNGGPATGPLP